jgi:putative hydrolase of HD superfamily
MSKKDIITAAGRLKRVKRQGWLDAGIPMRKTESVADHSFRVAVMAAFLAPAGCLDTLKMVRMALIHDMAESAIGDLTPRSGVPKRRKARMEEEAFRRLGSGELLSLWMEYEEGKTPEAGLVREMDARLARFWKGCKKSIRTPELKALTGRPAPKGKTGEPASR